MREILFRGKRLDNGEWVEGLLSQATVIAEDKAAYVATTIDEVVEKPFDGCWHEVDPATVGQFTGLLDKNGKRIFEGDVVSTGKEKRVVRFRNGAFELLRRASAVAMYDLVGTDVEYEVIGTIHDKEKQNEGK